MILGSDIHISVTISSQSHPDPTTRCTYAQVAITIHHDDCLAFVCILLPALDTRKALDGYIHVAAAETTHESSTTLILLYARIKELPIVVGLVSLLVSCFLSLTPLNGSGDTFFTATIAMTAERAPSALELLLAADEACVVSSCASLQRQPPWSPSWSSYPAANDQVQRRSGAIQNTSEPAPYSSPMARPSPPAMATLTFLFIASAIPASASSTYRAIFGAAPSSSRASVASSTGFGSASTTTRLTLASLTPQSSIPWPLSLPPVPPVTSPSCRTSPPHRLQTQTRHLYNGSPASRSARNFSGRAHAAALCQTYGYEAPISRKRRGKFHAGNKRLVWDNCHHKHYKCVKPDPNKPCVGCMKARRDTKKCKVAKNVPA
ncbi:hypothetical protein KCU81_g2172, partial [Aureobasidium melanogenum]|uniref:Uncharacterized protein n=1 Tax=Aureobasidium melanogenum (strain CBS 110374) TaxID=1043003 RepID=A0A074VWH0_AURM1